MTPEQILAEPARVLTQAQREFYFDLGYIGVESVMPDTRHPDPSSHAKDLVCGEAARWTHHDPRPCLLPPDWFGAYTSIYAAQAGEDGAGETDRATT